jgi:hypothetical protein
MIKSDLYSEASASPIDDCRHDICGERITV